MAVQAKYTRHLNVMVEQEVYDELADVAEQEGKSISAVAREAIDAWVAD
jgi:predicted HicB family RNase H-like nuclease